MRTPILLECLEGRSGPVIAATDYVLAYCVDGFGSSDARANLRRFFEVQRCGIARAEVAALAAEGRINGGMLPTIRSAGLILPRPTRSSLQKWPALNHSRDLPPREAAR